MRSHSNPALVLALIALNTLVTHGCAQKPVVEPQQRTVHKIPSEPPETAAGNPETPPPTQTEAAINAAMKAKQDFQETLAGNLRRLDEQRLELQLEVATLTEKTKAEWTEKLEELDAKREAAEAKLDELRSATGEAWEHLREGSQAAWQELETALKKAAEEF